jgi:hypothetical protein
MPLDFLPHENEPTYVKRIPVYQYGRAHTISVRTQARRSLQPLLDWAVIFACCAVISVTIAFSL